jgi:hypothetical protein
VIGLGKLVTVSEAILTREGALEEGDGGSTNFAKGVPLHSRHRRMGPEKRMIGVQIPARWDLATRRSHQWILATFSQMQG